MDDSSEACDDIISQNKIVIFAIDNCPYCISVKNIIKQYTNDFKVVMYEPHMRKWLVNNTGRRSLPAVFIDGEYVGGCNDGGIMCGVASLHARGLLADLI